MLQETVVVLSDPERGATILASGNAPRRISSQRTRAASSRSELMSFTPELVSNTKASVI